MFGECHAHIIMDGKNYRRAVELHKKEIQLPVIREHLEAYSRRNITFIRDGGDAFGVSLKAREIAPEYGIDYRTPGFAIHKNGHYGGIVGHGFSTIKEYHNLVNEAASKGADFIKIMTTGILDFADNGRITGEALSHEEVKEMIHIAHEEGFAVMCHTNGNAAIRDVISCKADSIEHGNHMDEDTVELLAESKTVWVPTISTIHNLLGSGRFEDAAIQMLEDKASQRIQEAYKRGALVALGSDAGAYCVFHGQGILDEYTLFKGILGNSPEIDRWLSRGESEIRKRFRRQ